MDIVRRSAAEGLGTFWLVLGGCGSATISAAFPGGIGMLGVALAFGLALLTMAYVIGPISGCHVNPAVTLGLCVAGRFPAAEIPAYVAAQVGGGIAAAILLMLIATGSPAYDFGHAGLAQNGYGPLSPGGYSLAACFITEFVLTGAFLFIILGATAKRAPAALAPLAIGLALTLIHLISIPVTNTSVNPARSTGPALLVGAASIGQLWLFWAAPLLGGASGALLYRFLFGREERDKVEGSAPDPLRPAASGQGG